MKRGWKLLTVGVALVGVSAIGSPAYATDEASLPTRTMTFVHGDTTQVVTTPDYAKSRFAAVRAKGPESCRAGWFCFYENKDAGGEGKAFLDPSWIDNLATVECECKPNKHNQNAGIFNDQISSFVNNTNLKWWWYFHANGYNPRHNVNPTHGKAHNLPDNENDEASSIYYQA